VDNRVRFALKTLLLLFALSFAGTALGGSRVTLDIRTGEGKTESMRAEILGFAEGRFRVRDLETSERADVPLADVTAIQFEQEGGDKPRTPVPNLQSVTQMAYARQFGQLRATLRRSVRAGERDVVAETVRRWEEMEGQLDRGSSKRETLLLAQWLALTELGDAQAAGEVWQRIEKDFPGTNPEDIFTREEPPRERPRRGDRETEAGDRVRDSRPRIERAPAPEEGRKRDGE
jgi:hypothetical protein